MNANKLHEPKDTDSSEEKFKVLPLALLALAVVVLALVIRAKKGSEADSESKPSAVERKGQTLPFLDPEYRKRVNEHLQQLDREQMLRRQEQEIEGYKQESIGLHPLENRPLQEPVGLDFKQDPRTFRTSQDIVSPSQKPDERRDLESQIDRGLRQKQLQRDYEKVYEREYIRTFLENARKEGYELKIDKDLQVADPNQTK